MVKKPAKTAKKSTAKAQKTVKKKAAPKSVAAKEKTAKKKIAAKKVVKKVGAKKEAAKKKAKKSVAKKGGGNAFSAAKALVFPPHKCIQTPGGCLMFFPDKDGQYLLPPGGQRVDCAACQHWF